MRARLCAVGLGMTCVMLLVLSASGAAGQDEKEQSPKVSDAPLSDEALAVYRAILEKWMNEATQPIFLSNATVPLDTDACGKTTPALENADPKVVHRFRAEDIPKLGRSNLKLVDPTAQAKEVADNDPGKAIREGKSVDEAVSNGFAHGLVTLSEVRFDEKHEHAIVWYGFHCGSLCGNGGTVLMEKKGGVWVRKDMCSVWMSRLEEPPPTGFLPRSAFGRIKAATENG